MLQYIRVMKMINWKSTNYEDLQIEASEKYGLNTKEKKLQSCDGLIIGKNIAIRKDLPTTIHKKCILVEEIGHDQTATGDILDQKNILNMKQERHGRIWGYNRIVNLLGIIAAYKRGCKTYYEMAEFLDITEDFLRDTIREYRAIYGVCVRSGGYMIYFEPYLTVVKFGE